DLRAGLLRRLFRRLGGDARAAHAADGGDQRHLVGDHRRGADRGGGGGRAGGQVAGAARGGAGQRQHLRRVRGDGADARHVQEEGAALMHEGAAVPAWAQIAYLVSGVCFILALRGLSSPVSAQRGNRFGIAGMTIAVVATLATHIPHRSYAWPPGNPFDARIDFEVVLEIFGAIAIGAAIGLVTARRIAMTAMPQLVAAFHSLVGLAAVLVAAAAYLNPEAFGIAVRITPVYGPSIVNILPVSRVEMGLGAAIGAITFSGSVIAFLKLNGNMSGKPILLPGRHVINLATLALIVGLVGYFTQDQAPWVFFSACALSFLIGFLLIVPIGGADMPVVVSMLNSYSGWAAAAMGFTLHNTAMIVTGALVGSSGAILSYIMCRAMNRSFLSVIAGGFGADTGKAGGAAKEQR